LRAEETTDDDGTGAGTDTPIEAGPDAAEYEVRFEGIDTDDGVGKLLTDVSSLLQLQDSPPATLAGLDRRAADDLESFATALRSEGYYGYTLSYDIDDSTDPVLVTIEVETGTVFTLESYDIVYTGDRSPPPAEAADLARLGLEIGMRARAPFIVGARTKLLTRLADRGRPLARVEDSEILVDHETGTMRVTLTVDPGPAATFGPTSFDGFGSVEAAYLERLVPWNEGDPYDQRLVDDYRRRVAETELFDSISVEHAAGTDADGSLPMSVALIESKHRTIGGAVSWSTDIGPGVSIFWEHRNAFGQGEKARIALDVSPVLQELDALLRKPAFRRIDQALLFQATATRENDEAFDETSLRFFSGIERKQNRYWTFLYGGEVEFSEITDNTTGTTQNIVFGLPLGARYDGTDDLLDPTKGSRLSLSTTPTVVTYDATHLYLATDVIASTYYSPFEGDRVIFAARGRLGSIVGVEPDAVPANRRFYAGGGGSVRGYEIRSIGPLAMNGDPLGGTSVWEAGFEARIRVSDDFGIVPFIDAGQVGREAWPSFSDRPQVAAGLGFRYYTGIGPVRLDVAFPLNPRGSDDSFQFYISLGQAF
jgi:translocation and assembly module TamA